MKTTPLSEVVNADAEGPVFKAGDTVVISSRFPVGHYRVPRYIRAKRCVIEAVIEPRALNNEEEGFGRNAARNGTIIALPFRSPISGPVMPGRSEEHTSELQSLRHL